MAVFLEVIFLNLASTDKIFPINGAVFDDERAKKILNLKIEFSSPRSGPENST